MMVTAFYDTYQATPLGFAWWTVRSFFGASHSDRSSLRETSVYHCDVMVKVASPLRPLLAESAAQSTSNAQQSAKWGQP